MKNAFLLFVTSIFYATSSAQNYGQVSQGQQANAVYCPELNLRYPNPQQCDVYIECINGIGAEKVCPDGLLFNSKAPFGSYPCQYPIEVDCEGRTGIQQAQATGQCPHQFGMYKLGDANQCGQYLNCANGIGYVSDCPEGLAFNEQKLQCDWPDQVANCNAEAFLGFSCPITGNSVYDTEAVRKYKHPTSCQKYFSCVKGRPRLANCGGHQAFNELISECDGAENVTGCGGNANPVRNQYQVPLTNPSQRYQQPAPIPASRPNYIEPFSNYNQGALQYNQAAPEYNQALTNYNQPAPEYTQADFNQLNADFNRQPVSSGFTSPNSNYNENIANINDLFQNYNNDAIPGFNQQSQTFTQPPSAPPSFDSLSAITSIAPQPLENNLYQGLRPPPPVFNQVPANYNGPKFNRAPRRPSNNNPFFGQRQQSRPLLSRIPFLSPNILN